LIEIAAQGPMKHDLLVTPAQAAELLGSSASTAPSTTG
jgi:hypothetical protein